MAYTDLHTRPKSLQGITEFYEKSHTMPMPFVIDGFSINRCDAIRYEGQTRNGRNSDKK